MKPKLNLCIFKELENRITMKKCLSLFTLLLCLITASVGVANQNKPVITYEQDNDPEYDSLKAAEYGADAYGMKKYVMAFLKAGPNRDLTPEESQKLQIAHLNNIDRMAEEGKLVLAGPFLGTGELRGIYIFNVETIEEAEELTKTDPAIKAGSLVMELMEWYGSAALVPVNDIHKTLMKVSVTEAE